jgi:hypothetical protein
MHYQIMDGGVTLTASILNYPLPLQLSPDYSASNQRCSGKGAPLTFMHQADFIAVAYNKEPACCTRKFKGLILPRLPPGIDHNVVHCYGFLITLGIRVCNFYPEPFR